MFILLPLLLRGEGMRTLGKFSVCWYIYMNTMLQEASWMLYTTN